MLTERALPRNAILFVRGRGLVKAIALVHIQTGFDIGESELRRMFCNINGGWISGFL